MWLSIRISHCFDPIIQNKKQYPDPVLEFWIRSSRGVWVVVAGVNWTLLVNSHEIMNLCGGNFFFLQIPAPKAQTLAAVTSA